MDPALEAIAAAQGGVFLRGQALAVGYSDKEIAKMKWARAWHQVRRGAYMDAGLWAQLDEVDRHRAKVHSAARQLTVPCVVSHVSAAVLLDLDVWGVDLSTVHVTRLGAHSPRIEAGVHHHVGRLDESEVMELGGLLVTVPSRTGVDVARSVAFEQAVVTLDSALRSGDVQPGALLDVLDGQRAWRGARAAGRAISFADGRAESVGESRHRVQIRRIGLPSPELQVVIEIDGGDARLDFLFVEQLTVGEFDGRGKLGRWLNDGETPESTVWQEKLREDRIRERGFEVVRPVWRDLRNDAEVARRYRRAFERARGRRVA